MQKHTESSRLTGERALRIDEAFHTNPAAKATRPWAY
jgi:hypothetical protein